MVKEYVKITVIVVPPYALHPFIPFLYLQLHSFTSSKSAPVIRTLDLPGLLTKKRFSSVKLQFSADLHVRPAPQISSTDGRRGTRYVACTGEVRWCGGRSVELKEQDGRRRSVVPPGTTSSGRTPSIVIRLNNGLLLSTVLCLRHTRHIAFITRPHRLCHTQAHISFLVIFIHRISHGRNIENKHSKDMCTQ